MPLRGVGTGFLKIRPQIDHKQMAKMTESEKVAKKAEKVKEKRREDIKALAERGMYIHEGHAPKPGTFLRIMDIAEDIAKGKPYIKIITEFVDKYGIDKKKAEDYYEAAIAFLTPKDIDKYQQKMAAKLLAQYENLYERASENGQLKTARDILDSIAKICQLTGGNRVQIAKNDNGEEVINIQFN